jgi:hypothetical protein
MNFHRSASRVGKESVDTFPLESLHQDITTLARSSIETVNPFYRRFRSEGSGGITAGCVKL